MREIKFRIWDIRNKEFCDFFPLNSHGAENAFWNGKGCSGYIFLQYTGLKDCNGKEIFEGDIVKRQTGSIYQ